MDGKQHSCGRDWAVSRGPGRHVGPIARSLPGVLAPLPDEFEYEYCPSCQVRNITPEIEEMFLAFEKRFLEAGVK